MIAPLLIDSRGLLKLGFSLTLTAIFIFGGGFFVGAQQAAAIQQAGNYNQALILPERGELSEDSIASSPPETIAAGEDIDVDQPKAAPAVSADSTTAVIVTVKKDKQPVDIVLLKSVPLKSASETPASENKTHVSKRPSTETALSRPKDTESQMSGKPDGVSDLEQAQSVKKDAVADSATIASQLVSENSVATHLVTALTSKELSEVKYSVQVGMYGQLVNAENMMKMLQAQQFNAYITDYRNKKDEVRYNVRFGYFADRKSAIKRLKKFKNDQVGDGYLVRFSADNIVNLADTTAITKPIVLPVAEESANDSNKPGEASVKNEANNISQNEMFSTDASI